MAQRQEETSDTWQQSHLSLHKSTIWKHSEFVLWRAKTKHFLEKEVRRILKDIYIDNLITDVESKEKGHHMSTISKKKFKEILTNMREWKSSSAKINNVFNENEMKESQFRVLGLN